MYRRALTSLTSSGGASGKRARREEERASKKPSLRDGRSASSRRWLSDRSNGQREARSGAMPEGAVAGEGERPTRKRKVRAAWASRRPCPSKVREQVHALPAMRGSEATLSTRRSVHKPAADGSGSAEAAPIGLPTSCGRRRILVVVEVQQRRYEGPAVLQKLRAASVETKEPCQRSRAGSLRVDPPWSLCSSYRCSAATYTAARRCKKPDTPSSSLRSERGSRRRGTNRPSQVDGPRCSTSANCALGRHSGSSSGRLTSRVRSHLSDAQASASLRDCSSTRSCGMATASTRC